MPRASTHSSLSQSCAHPEVFPVGPLAQYVKQETIEDTPTGRVARATRQISERASTRIGRMAFEIALAAAQVKAQRGTSASSYGWTGKPTVTIVHKSNVLSVTDGLFRESVRKVASEYPGVEVNEQIVDSLVYRCVPFALSPSFNSSGAPALTQGRDAACSVSRSSSRPSCAPTSTATSSRKSAALVSSCLARRQHGRCLHMPAVHAD